MLRFTSVLTPVLLVASLLLAGCVGGGTGGDATDGASAPATAAAAAAAKTSVDAKAKAKALPPGKPIVTTAKFKTYATTGAGPKWNRVRLDKPLQQRGKQALAAFDGPGANPAGYLRYDLAGPAYNGDMVIEAIAEVDTGSGKAKRLLRLTADQSQFTNEKNGKLIAAKGQYHFRGASFAWVTIDKGPLLSGSHSEGLTDLKINFKTQTATIALRTEVAPGSDVEIKLNAKNMPFNIRTGAYGGDVVIRVRNPDRDQMFSVDGSLRGNIGGTPGYANDTHGMTTSGIITGSGTSKGKKIVVDGIYFGRDPNVLR